MFTMMNDGKSIEYMFYRRVRRRKDQYVGSLTERRKDIRRITCNSIMNYARELAVREVYKDQVYFIPVKN